MSVVKSVVQNIRDFYHYAGNGLIVLFILSLAAGVVELVGVGLMLPVLNLGFKSAGTDQISKLFETVFSLVGYTPTLQSLLILLVLVFGFKACANFIIKYFSSTIAVDLKGTLQKALTDNLSLVSYTHFTELKSGWLNNVLMKEVALYTQGFSEFVRIQITIIYIAVYFATASLLRLDLTLVLVVASFALLYPMRGLMRVVRSSSKQLTKRSGILSNGFVELIDNFIYAKATGAIQGFRVHIAEKILRMNQAEKKLLFFSAFIQSISEPVAVTALAVLVYTQVVLGNSQLSEVLILGLVIHRIVGQVMLLQGQWQRFNSTFGSIEVVKHTLDDFARHREKNGHEVIDKIRDIAMRDVRFSYGDKMTLNHVTLDIPCNRMIGIVGASGSGKTTLFYLLTGLLTADSGVIEVNGLDYRTINKSSLRKRIGYVPQSPAMIDDTLLENINFGSYDRDDPTLKGKVQAAMKLAGLDELADDLDRQAGERGVQFSGGQRQRIAIARELLRDTDMLILDEATSALDAQSDRKIQDTLARLKGTKTIVIISHKPDNLKNCDAVYRIENGVLSLA